jgi:hypothetical protein
MTKSTNPLRAIPAAYLARSFFANSTCNVLTRKAERAERGKIVREMKRRRFIGDHHTADSTASAIMVEIITNLERHSWHDMAVAKAKSLED